MDVRGILGAACFVAAFAAAAGAGVSWRLEHAPRGGRAAAAVRAVRLPSPEPSPLPSPSPSPSPALAARAAALPSSSAPAARPQVRPAPPAMVVGSYQQTLINRDRAAAGLPPLTWSSCLAGVAAQNAARMAAAGSISHDGGLTEDLGCGLGPNAGENLGYWTGGVDDVQLNQMFMASPDHRANILGPFRYVGTDWVVAPNGTAYLAVEFA